MDGGDAKLRRLLEQQFQSIELEERNEQMHRQLRRRIRKPFRDPESHLGFPRSFDLREIKRAIIGYFEDLADFHAKHLCEMARLITGDLGLAVAHLLHEK